MSELGFADAVKKYGDDWRISSTAIHLQAGHRKIARALVKSNGPVSSDFIDYLAMHNLAWRRRRQTRRAA